jgi:hypothetical protein
VLIAFHSRGQQVLVLVDDILLAVLSEPSPRGQGDAPLGTQVVLDGVEHGDEDADGLDRAQLVGAAQHVVAGGGLGLVVRHGRAGARAGGVEVDLRGLQAGGHGGRGHEHEDLAGHAADGRGHGVDVQAAGPEAREGGLVTEDEHETDDDGEGGDLGVFSREAGGERGDIRYC